MWGPHPSPGGPAVTPLILAGCHGNSAARKRAHASNLGLGRSTCRPCSPQRGPWVPTTAQASQRRDPASAGRACGPTLGSGQPALGPCILPGKPGSSQESLGPAPSPGWLVWGPRPLPRCPSSAPSSSQLEACRTHPQLRAWDYASTLSHSAWGPCPSLEETQVPPVVHPTSKVTPPAAKRSWGPALALAG